MYYPCSENKTADQLRGNRYLFSLSSHYADCLFSHEAAHMLLKHYAVLMDASIVYILD